MKSDPLKVIGLTLGAMALTAIVFVLSQLQACLVERPMLKKQIDYFAEKYASSQASIRENEALLRSREEQVQQMAGLEVKYTNLIASLMELSKTDQDARAVILKWKIQVSGQPASSAPRALDTNANEPRDSKLPRQAPGPAYPNPKPRNGP